MNYFCAYCHRRLNEYWEESQKGKSPLLLCIICQELTFGYQQHCISCGAELLTRIKRPGEFAEENKEINLEKDKKSSIVAVGLLIPAAILLLIPVFGILVTSAEIGSFWWEFLGIVLIFVLPFLICIIAIIFFVLRVVSVRKVPKSENEEKMFQ